MDTNTLLDTKVREKMTAEVVTVGPTDVMATVEKLMIENGINHIPIVDKNQKLLGILTKNDVQLLKNWGTNLNLRTARKANDQLLQSNTAKDRMNHELVTVGPDATLEFCADIFKENVFHALPVTEGDRLVGIITTYDMLVAAYTRV